ncbi:hypothetical protein [Histidinibacterium aquaticum]|uniref:Glycosyltransferase RgtA/B/C/D-like domain-containing protein n=1 Tax=Histidinibacterium aquaticum TaxID=2613962 RepID=A0A5J5GJY1_9RHOB|nr:hypothetical protein [Histidinibacterium aquaticum]KAA9007832.1 hypothetical protein F3S47_09910 [Histidinibacterium aquaticum]
MIRPGRVSVAVLLALPLWPLRGLIAPADHAGYIDFVQEAGGLRDLSGLSAKLYVGVFFDAVERAMPWRVFTNGVLAAYLLCLAAALRSLGGYALALVLTLPVIIHLDYISKEAILVFLLLCAVATARGVGRRAGHAVLVAGLAAFALFIRPYYALPLAAALAVAALGWWRGSLAVGAGLAAMALAFPWPLAQLEAAREAMYVASQTRFGTRTIYPGVSLDPETGPALRAVQNYLAVLRGSLLPVTWTATVKDLYAQVFALAFVALARGAVRRGDPLFAGFGVFMALTVPFFSPDLGTSLRHVAAAATFLWAALALGRAGESRAGGSAMQILPVLP